MPATFVAWSESIGSNGVFAYFHAGCAGANARATITFGVVYAVFPFGKPGGYAKLAPLKKTCDWSRPSSMIPILMPWPAVASVDPQMVGAPMSFGVRSRSAWYVTLGQTVAPGIASRRPSSEAGTTTAIPLRTTPYRQRTRAVGIAATIRLWSARCAEASVRRYETAAGARTSSRWRVVAAAARPRSRRIASDRGGCGSVTTTSVMPAAAVAGTAERALAPPAASSTSAARTTVEAGATLRRETTVARLHFGRARMWRNW
jgi:hypothetical protein